MELAEVVEERRIAQILNAAEGEPTKEEVGQILAKAMEKKGLSPLQAARLLNIEAEELLRMLFAASSAIKREIYGNRLVWFAPIYLSNYCTNSCAYCGFSATNAMLKRKRLSLGEVAEQTRALIRMGHKRLLVEAGESEVASPIDYICDCIREIYATKEGRGEIRRVNVNIAATTTENYRKLKEVGIGTYQLFQETYHRKTYEKMHRGPKGDYQRQLTAHCRAFEAGLDDYGMGVLFGLYDYKFEVVSLLSHARWMEERYGVGPHTVSVPRIKPAPGICFVPPAPVSDRDFLKLIAVYRLALPYTGMIISTREPPEIREKAFEIGISQASVGSRTAPGGYADGGAESAGEQFELSDRRGMEETIASVCARGHIPSFCTACYRSKRTGEAFMRLAKTGEINKLCTPNALLTFKEFLVDYASPSLRKEGEALIERMAGEVEKAKQEEFRRRLKRIENGERDLFF
ncbi:MAG: [FeFe] hydrogenase H-cluster radical SAM maturase HydG [Candidatus Micrarchaeota archaeon]|nr:[FeFe] hydrogenase H-cluster radical SAM maturase HydG [Candidatus Micrarchaeota archaeon]